LLEARLRQGRHLNIVGVTTAMHKRQSGRLDLLRMVQEGHAWLIDEI